jgi:alpha-D-ribose 1-methylphosphonate 5-phosphate C-P lyase
MSPSPIPKYDNPKLHRSPAVLLFGAGREKRIYAVPPYTDVVSLDFEDYPFELEQWEGACAVCGSTQSFLDEIITDDTGTRVLICSDTEFCRKNAGRSRP